jgi:hypothetical protein
MPEIGNIIFSYKEVVIALLKAHGIHEGKWALFVRFGLNAANIGESDTDLRPTAVIPLLELGLQKAEKDTNISVDAAVANPKQQTTTSATKGRTH